MGPRHKTTHSYEHSFLCRLCIDRVYVPCQCNHSHQIQVRLIIHIRFRRDPRYLHVFSYTPNSAEIPVFYLYFGRRKFTNFMLLCCVFSRSSTTTASLHKHLAASVVLGQIVFMVGIDKYDNPVSN